MTDTELKLALAKMLPEVVERELPCIGISDGTAFFWKQGPHRINWELVRDTELLHLVSLAEAKLTPDEYERYWLERWKIAALGQPVQESIPIRCLRAFVSMPWNQCTLAL